MDRSELPKGTEEPELLRQPGAGALTGGELADATSCWSPETGVRVEGVREEAAGGRGQPRGRRAPGCQSEGPARPSPSARQSGNKITS